MFEFYIDGTKYDNPVNWGEFAEVLEFTESLKVFSYKYPSTLTFTEAAYNYLYTVRGTQGICYSAVILIKQKCNETAQYKTIFTGTIYVSDCKFLINKCQVECSIVDNSYTSLIFNNKTLQVDIGDSGRKTKNGLDTTAEPAYFSNPVDLVPVKFAPITNFIPFDIAGVDYFTYSLGTLTPSVGCPFTLVPSGIYIWDAFNYLIHFLSDNKVHFKSDYLNYYTQIADTSNTAKNLMVTTGGLIRTIDQTDGFGVAYSFDDLFIQLNKLYPVSIGIEYEGDGTPVIRIENDAYFKQNTVSLTLNKVANVEEKADNSLLFGKINAGTSNTIAGTYNPKSLYTFGEESYYVGGQCNLDVVKDVTSTIIFDTNILEEIMTNTPGDSYGSDLIFIEVDPSQLVAQQYAYASKTVNYDNPTRYHYNENLMNYYIINRNNFVNDIFFSAGGTGAANIITASVNDASAYIANTVSFERPLDNDSYQTLKDNLPLAIQYNIDGTTNKKAWIKKLTRKLSTGEMKWELISNITNIQ